MGILREWELHRRRGVVLIRCIWYRLFPLELVALNGLLLTALQMARHAERYPTHGAGSRMYP